MPDPTLPRRTAVGLGVGLLGGGLTAACGAERAPAADSDVVDRARDALAVAEGLVRRTMRRHPALRPSLRPALALHRRHDELLSPSGGGDPDVPDVPAVPDGLPAALALVQRREQALQAELVALTLRARSGPLARVLAGMAAGTAQQVVLLERA